MGRSQETYNKKEVRTKKEKKRKEKEQKRQARRENDTNSFDDMIAYVDENGNITSTPPNPAGKTETALEDIEIGTPKREAEPERNPIRTGTITYFNDSKGFGFIKDAETGDSVFVHSNQSEDQLTQGNRVSFEVERGHKGMSAVRVKKV